MKCLTKLFFLFVLFRLIACSTSGPTLSTQVPISVVTVYPVETPPPQSTPIQKPDVTPISADYPVLDGVLVGYYTKIEKEGFQNQKKTCDSFIVISGEQRLIQAWLVLVDSGNSVNAKNEMNQPIISIHLDELDDQSRETILKSTDSSPIAVRIASLPERPMGADLCTSPVKLTGIINK